MKLLSLVLCCCLGFTQVALAQEAPSEPSSPSDPAQDPLDDPPSTPIDPPPTDPIDEPIEDSSADEGTAEPALETPADPQEAPPASFKVKVDADYLWDGGALPFVYGSSAIALGFRLFVSPPARPRLFSESEGGATVHADTVPEYALALGAGAGAAMIALVPGTGRWHHFKGYMEALATTIALTEVTKNVIGRHRPTFVEGDTSEDQRRSFFSGHASITSVSTVYLGIYVHEHLMPRWRGPAAPAMRLLTYGALGAAYVGVPYSRVHDHRHNLSDVATGAAVGTAFAIGFYAYQESRLIDSEEAFYRHKRSQVMLVPDLENRGLQLVSVW